MIRLYDFAAVYTVENSAHGGEAPKGTGPGRPCKNGWARWLYNITEKGKCFMDCKVILYNSSDVKIGETYVRRARQLVKQQRAFWVDDGQRAIKFVPGMENLNEAASVAPPGLPMPAADSYADKELMKIAKRRVRARFAFRVHLTIFVVLSLFFMAIYVLSGGSGHFWPRWPIFGIGFGVFVHWIILKLVTTSGLNDKIANEYAQLKYQYLRDSYEDKRD